MNFFQHAIFVMKVQQNIHNINQCPATDCFFPQLAGLRFPAPEPAQTEAAADPPAQDTLNIMVSRVEKFGFEKVSNQQLGRSLEEALYDMVVKADWVVLFDESSLKEVVNKVIKVMIHLGDQ